MIVPYPPTVSNNRKDHVTGKKSYTKEKAIYRLETQTVPSDIFLEGEMARDDFL